MMIPSAIEIYEFELRKKNGILRRDIDFFLTHRWSIYYFQITLNCLNYRNVKYQKTYIHCKGKYLSAVYEKKNIQLYLPICVIFRTGNISGAKTSKIPEHTTSFSILNCTQIATNFSFNRSFGVPNLTSFCNRRTPARRKECCQ